MLNVYETRLREAIDGLNTVIIKITKENMEAEFINLDYRIALIKTAIKMQLDEKT